MSKEIDDLLRQQDDVVVTLYTEEQVREIAKFTISQWTSLNEQREYDHKDLVDVWLDNDLCNFIQSLKQNKQ